MTPAPIPAEPPVGTLVRDRHGAIHRRYADGWGKEFDRSHHLGVWTALVNFGGVAQGDRDNDITED